MDRRRFLALSAGTAAALATARMPAAGARRPSRTSGISWPAGQVLPRFAAPTRLAVSDITGRPADEQLLLISLQGLVNRTRPEIYLLNTAGEGAATWLGDIGVDHDAPVDTATLVARYRDRANGAVVYDPALPATINLATTIAGLDGFVVTSAALAAKYGFQVRQDLTGQFADELAAYSWAVQTLWPRTGQRMVVNLNPSITGYLRDYAVAAASLTVWLDHSNADHLALIEQLGDELPFNAPWIGWLRGGESPTVETLSNREVHVLASDTMTNLTVHSGTQAAIDRHPYRAPAPALQDKVYVTFTYSDGDNLQYVQHRMRMSWDDPARGTVPINWPVPPQIVDAAPAMYVHYQRTATQADSLVAGPSGLGYVFPSAWPAATFGRCAAQAGRYATRAGMRSIAVLNRLDSTYVPIPEAAVAAYRDSMELDGLFENWFYYMTDDLVTAGVPIARSRLALSQDDLRDALGQAAGVLQQRGAPVFIMVFLHAWTVTPTDAATVRAEQDERFVFVRGDQFFALQRQAHGLPVAGPAAGSPVS